MTVDEAIMLVENHVTKFEYMIRGNLSSNSSESESSRRVLKALKMALEALKEKKDRSSMVVNQTAFTRSRFKDMDLSEADLFEPMKKFND